MSKKTTMTKKLFLFFLLCCASRLPAQVVEDVRIMPAPEVEIDVRKGKARFGNYRSGRPEQVTQGYKTGWALDDSLLVPIEFYKMPNTYSDFMVVNTYEGKWGVIDKHGKTVLPFEYDQGGEMYPRKQGDPACFLSKNGHQQYFDRSGKVLFETDFEALNLESTIQLGNPDWLVVSKMNPEAPGELSAISDRSGKLLFPFKYYHIDWATKYYVGVSEGQKGKHGFCDWQGREIVAPTYDALIAPDENHLLVGSLGGGKGGLLDTTGRVVLPFEYDLCSRRFDLKQFYDLKKGELKGLADAQGKIVVPVELSGKPTPIYYHSLISVPDSFGLKATRNEDIRGDFWMGSLGPGRSALYHIRKGLVLKGAYLNFQVLNDEGPIAVLQTDQQQRLIDMDGKDLLGSAWQTIYPNVFRTVIFAIAADKTARIFHMDGSPAAPELLKPPDYTYGTLPYGYFAMPDMNNRFALFDPYGKRLTDFRFYYIQRVDEQVHKTALEKNYLRPGRRIIAKGMADVPSRGVMTFLWIDDTGMIVNE
jgi:hypothetical protein